MEDLTHQVIEKSGLSLDSDALNQLAETRKWTMLISIIGLIFIGVVFIIFILRSIGSNFRDFLEYDLTSLISLLLVSVLYVFPIYYLLQFSSYTKHALIHKNNALLSKALFYQKMHYRFMGVLIIVILCLSIIASVFMIFMDNSSHIL